MKTYKDIQKSIADLGDKKVENNVLKSLEVSITAHFGNTVTCEMLFDNCCLFSTYNLGALTAEILKAVVECLDLSQENGLRISSVKNVPVRTVFDKLSNRVIGFGHFMRDRFLLAEELLEMAKSNMEADK